MNRDPNDLAQPPSGYTPSAGLVKVAVLETPVPTSAAVASTCGGSEQAATSDGAGGGGAQACERHEARWQTSPNAGNASEGACTITKQAAAGDMHHGGDGGTEAGDGEMAEPFFTTASASQAKQEVGESGGRHRAEGGSGAEAAAAAKDTYPAHAAAEEKFQRAVAPCQSSSSSAAADSESASKAAAAQSCIFAEMFASLPLCIAPGGSEEGTTLCQGAREIVGETYTDASDFARELVATSPVLSRAIEAAVPVMEAIADVSRPVAAKICGFVGEAMGRGNASEMFPCLA